MPAGSNVATQATQQSDAVVASQAARPRDSRTKKFKVQSPGQNSVGLPVVLAASIVIAGVWWWRNRRRPSSKGQDAYIGQRGSSGSAFPRGTSQSNKKNKQRKRAERQRRAEARDRPAQESATRGDEQRRERDPPMVVQNLSYYDNTNASSNNAPVQRRKPTGF